MTKGLVAKSDEAIEGWLRRLKKQVLRVNETRMPHESDDQWMARLKNPMTPVPVPSVVYFAMTADYTKIKIGFSTNYPNRLKQLSHARPGEGLRLLTVLPGTRVLERQLHRQFAKWALGHEWFRNVYEIRKWLHDLQTHEKVAR